MQYFQQKKLIMKFLYSTMRIIYLQCFLFVLNIYHCTSNEVRPSCSAEERICKFYLHLNVHMTMSVRADAPGIKDAHFIPLEYKHDVFTQREACTSKDFSEEFIKNGMLMFKYFKSKIYLIHHRYAIVFSIVSD